MKRYHGFHNPSKHRIELSTQVEQDDIEQRDCAMTGASGFDYVAHYTDADKAIDALWAKERRDKLNFARTVLIDRARSVLIEILIRRVVAVISKST